MKFYLYTVSFCIPLYALYTQSNTVYFHIKHCIERCYFYHRWFSEQAILASSHWSFLLYLHDNRIIHYCSQQHLRCVVQSLNEQHTRVKLTKITFHCGEMSVEKQMGKESLPLFSPGVKAPDLCI